MSFVIYICNLYLVYGTDIVGYFAKKGISSPLPIAVDLDPLPKKSGMGGHPLMKPAHTLQEVLYHNRNVLNLL